MQVNDELLSALTGRMRAHSDALAAADAIAIWHLLARRFGPLIGPRSESMLLARSLELNLAAYPWLPQATQPEVAEPPFTALRIVLEEQRAPAVLAAMGALLGTYIDLLSSLIGSRLAAQFLRSALADDGAHENKQEKNR